jgi:hypothetical protein
MTIRGGGNPHTAMAAMPLGEWTRRLGALPVEAYDCFMVGTYMGSTEYKRGSRQSLVANGRLPSGHRVAIHPITAVCRRARVGQGRAFGGAEEAPSLTLATCGGDGNMRSGRKNARGRGSNKRMEKNKVRKWCAPHLTKKAPYKPYAGKPHVRICAGGGE